MSYKRVHNGDSYENSYMLENPYKSKSSHYYSYMNGTSDNHEYYYSGKKNNNKKTIYSYYNNNTASTSNILPEWLNKLFNNCLQCVQ